MIPRTLEYDEVSIGEPLPELSIPLTRTLIVATAMATRDYEDVHHDPALAEQRGSPDIFLNILTSNGLVDRFVTDWAGPASVVRSIRIRLGVPSYPGDTLVLTGAVEEKTDHGVRVSVRGENSLGAHLTGTVVVDLLRKDPC